MSEIMQLWLLPVATCIIGLVGIAVPSVIGGANGDLQWILPFISDGGAIVPEKNIFTMFQNISAILIALTIYIKHVQFVKFYQRRRSDSWRVLSLIMTLIGLLAAFGLSLVGDFSETDVPVMHDTAASIAFAVYIIISSGLSFLRPLLCSFPIAVLRVVLAFLTAASLIFHTAVLEFEMFFPPGANLTAYSDDGPPVFLDYDSPYFVHHTIATGSEWALGILIFVYFITFVAEFRKSSFVLPSVNFHDDRLNDRSIEKRLSEEDVFKN